MNVREEDGGGHRQARVKRTGRSKNKASKKTKAPQKPTAARTNAAAGHKPRPPGRPANFVRHNFKVRIFSNEQNSQGRNSSLPPKNGVQGLVAAQRIFLLCCTRKRYISSDACPSLSPNHWQPLRA